MSQSSKVLKEFGAVSAVGSNVELVSGAGALGALSLASEVSIISTTGAATGTLGDATPGAKKTIIVAAHAGNYVLTPTNFANGTTLTFAAANSTVTLVFVNSTVGWVSANVGSVAPTIA